MLRSFTSLGSAGPAAVLALVLQVMPVLAATEPGRLVGTFESEIGCAKARALGPQTCRRAFARAVAEFETKTKAYPNRYACFRVFGPCMPWPLHSPTRAQFRPQWMGVSISMLGSDMVAVPLVAPGKTRMVFAPRPLSGDDASSSSLRADRGAPNAVAGGTAERLRAVCGLIETEARREDLPVAFLTRLLWQESSFRSEAISAAGAQGIAQFMPGTAGDRGLDDPFDPRKAIKTSASLLRDLSRRFGNLGLAAAAYNGGPARVSGWLRGHRALPDETRTYVLRITGRRVEDWTDIGKSSGPPERTMSCVEAAGEMVRTSW